jgi:hypothetical protein
MIRQHRHKPEQKKFRYQAQAYANAFVKIDEELKAL